MTFLSTRRVAACIASVAAVAGFALPATASAKSDLLKQCEGTNIVARGSTFQFPAQEIWMPGFNKTIAADGCSGTQGSKGTPKVEYRNTLKEDRGSGACLKAFGAEKEPPLYNIYSFCGTDEAPNVTQRSEIEAHAVGAEEQSLETIPVLQGAVAVIVHLPAECKAKSIVEEKGKIYDLGRLALDNASIDKIYRGEINTWKKLLEEQPTADGHNEITCKNASELEDEIVKVVRQDHSGTTHIFKAYLEQVDNTPFEAEAYPEEYSGSKTGCGKEVTFPEESKTWSEVAEACQNQRWPKAAKVVHVPSESGNSGVIKEVNAVASSIGYADLAFARNEGFFSKKGLGGENKKGSATKFGEQNVKFWAVVQNGENLKKEVTYADPASNGDVEAKASSNCKNTIYSNKAGLEFPPESTRNLWNGAKAELKEENYPLCGLTYDITFREFKPYLNSKPTTAEEEEGKKRATTTENYLLYEVNGSAGGKDIKNHDYEVLPKEVLKIAETGIKTIGYAIP